MAGVHFARTEENVNRMKEVFRAVVRLTWMLSTTNPGVWEKDSRGWLTGKVMGLPANCPDETPTVLSEITPFRTDLFLARETMEKIVRLPGGEGLR